MNTPWEYDEERQMREQMEHTAYLNHQASQSDWQPIADLPDAGGSYLAAWFMANGDIGMCSVIDRSHPDNLWRCAATDTLAGGAELATWKYTHFMTIPKL